MNTIDAMKTENSESTQEVDSLRRLVRRVWVPCYEYALAERSKLMLWFIWCVLARLDPQRPYYAPILRPWKWKCRRCGQTFPRHRGWSTSTHEDSECSNPPNDQEEQSQPGTRSTTQKGK